MTIAEAMQEADGVLRLSCGERWLANNEASGWVVYERKHRKHNTRIVIDTTNEHEAVRYLLGREPKRLSGGSDADKRR